MKKNLFLAITILMCFSFILGGCSLADANKDASDEDFSGVVSERIKEINDVFVASGGRTEELHRYLDKSASIEGYPDMDSFNGFAEVHITSKGNIEGLTYSFIVDENQSHQEALINVQSDYESLQNILCNVSGMGTLADERFLPDDFVNDFLATESNSLDKHYGGNLDDKLMWDISFTDGVIKVSIGHRSKG